MHGMVKIPNFDNTDDYREELQKVKQIQGQDFKFDYNDYVVKILLATFVRWYFNIDQQNVTGDTSLKYQPPQVTTTQQQAVDMSIQQQGVDTSTQQQYVLQQTPVSQQPEIRTIVVAQTNDGSDNRNKNCCACCSIL